MPARHSFLAHGGCFLTCFREGGFDVRRFVHQERNRPAAPCVATALWAVSRLKAALKVDRPQAGGYSVSQNKRPAGFL